MAKRFLVAALLSLMVGCGGGGGSTGPTAPAGYSGNTAPAKVTATNAKAVSIDAYSGSEFATSMSVLKPVSATATVQGPLVPKVVDTLERSVASLAPASKSTAKSVAATATMNSSMSGYSGSMNYSITVSDSGAASGSVVFSNYQEFADSAVINGTISFSAVYNQSAVAFSSFSMTMADITGIYNGESVTMNGSLSMSQSGTTATTTVTMVLTDNVSLKTYGLRNYRLVLSNGTSLTVSGTYYDPDHGYVTISTLTPLTVSALSETPTAGVLLFTGENGSNARLTFDSTGYVVEVDAAGTGSYVLVP